jgi:ribosome biogenesis GTPase
VQPIAANVDLAIVVAAISPEGSDARAERHAANPRRILRYLAAARASGARAIVALNKADLRPDHAELAEKLAAELGGATVVATSSKSRIGLEQLFSHWSVGETAVLLGSSGVGKSSLTNALLGREARATAAVRESDHRGRHTTTGRELFVLPHGGLIIDTPGMREFAPVGDASAITSPELDDLATQCRFRDCRHTGEPGCAVRAAVDAGTLDGTRLAE